MPTATAAPAIPRSTRAALAMIHAPVTAGEACAMTMIGLRPIGSRAAADTGIVGLHGADGIEHAEDPVQPIGACRLC